MSEREGRFATRPYIPTVNSSKIRYTTGAAVALSFAEEDLDGRVGSSI